MNKYVKYPLVLKKNNKIRKNFPGNRIEIKKITSYYIGFVSGLISVSKIGEYENNMVSVYFDFVRVNCLK